VIVTAPPKLIVPVRRLMSTPVPPVTIKENRLTESKPLPPSTLMLCAWIAPLKKLW